MMRISEAAALLGERHEGDALFSRVLSDTRALQPGALFVALRGENFDGHNFLAAAQSAGAVAAMVSRIPADAPEGLPLLLVNDTRAALGALAAHWRMRFSLPLVGVTGSNGKTTVKEMCAAILREASLPPPGMAFSSYCIDSWSSRICPGRGADSGRCSSAIRRRICGQLVSSA